MVNYAVIQQKIDRGRGRAARRLGQPFLGYRLLPSSTGDFPKAWQLLPIGDPPIFRRRLKSEREIESAIANATMFLDIIGDMSAFLLGDVFIQNDPPYVSGVSYGVGATKVFLSTVADLEDQFNGFGFAWHAPVKKAVGGRLDRLVRIYRAANLPTTFADRSQYWQTTHPGDQAFVMSNGMMVLGAPGQQGSLVPCGFTSAYRPYGPLPFKPSPPGMTRPFHLFAYLPPLPGYIPREGDAIITMDDQRYVVVEPFYQTAGVVGSQMVIDRTGAGVV